MILKFKKSFTTAAIALSLLVSAQSAFAITGLGDSESSAVAAAANVHYTWKLETAYDEDWFVYTNNTSSSVSITAAMTSPSGQNYNLDPYWYQNGNRIKLSVNDNGPGKTDSFTLSNLRPGEKISFRIYTATGSVNNSPYDFYYTVN
ncbi:hypothetical protein [Paenibacillus sp. RC67]|uniref:hypothetical protein n=1 Tax=Paenibacillus sp. RC67 TaxID=3039392 RepID=UPI0024AE4179|nr:hypothetical protein [Paenibacillus sp. RC67]